jgi:hypothetical protein
MRTTTTNHALGCGRVQGRFGLFALHHFPFHRNKKGASRISGRAHCFYPYFQTSKSEGVNPPIFKIYISLRISGLEGIECFYPLDKIPGKTDFAGFPAAQGEPP